MTYSFIGLAKPIAAVNNILKSHIKAYRKANPGTELPLTPGGVFSSNLSAAASFAGDNDMCVYLSLDDLLEKSDIIFMFLPDKSIKSISLKLGKNPVRNKIFCHFSPSFPADILDFSSHNTYLSMCLPYFIKDNDGHTTANRIIIEGYGKGLNKLTSALEEIGVNFNHITFEEKLMYYAAVSMAKDFPVILQYAAQRLIKYAFGSHKELSDELFDLVKENVGIFNSYNAVDNEDADFALRQCETLKSLGIEDITNLYSALLTIYSHTKEPTENTQRIADIAKRIK